MFTFEYYHPTNLNEALRLLKENDGEIHIFAGGTDLLPRARAGKADIKKVLDIERLNLSFILTCEEEIVIGAATRLFDIVEYFKSCEQPMRLLWEAAASVGSCQTRSLATIGGNICTGNSSSDIAGALLALDARLKIVSMDSEREIPIDSFFTGARQVDLRPGEMLEEIRINIENLQGCGSCFIKLGKRKGHSVAIASAAAVVRKGKDGTIEAIRIALGTLAAIPFRAYATEKCLLHCNEGALPWETAMEMVSQEISPRTSTRSTEEYRRAVAPTLVRRAVCASLERSV